jgi:hypothetical protein
MRLLRGGGGEGRRGGFERADLDCVDISKFEGSEVGVKGGKKFS